MNKCFLLTFFLLGLLLLQSNSVFSQADSTNNKQEKKKKMSVIDPEDGALDLSAFLKSPAGFFPVPIIITEPAVGYGGGAALIFFHGRKKQYNSYVPPNISGVMGFGTENGTWGLGGFHSHVFGENRVRTITAFIKPTVNIDYYGNNSELLSKHPLRVKLDPWIFFQRVQLRLAKSKFYVGLSYTYSNTEVSLDTIPGRPLLNEIIKRLTAHSVVSTIKPMVVFDSRDNVFTPTKGISAEISFNYSPEWLGSSSTYSIFNLKFLGYQPINSRLFSGWRFQGNYLSGDAPFYAYPFVQLRGIPAMRYQSDITLVAETEWRYEVYKRWSLIAFTGGGKAFESFDNFDDIDWAYTFGTGFRYKIAKAFGLHSGLDFAWGNGEDFAFYIVFGSSWH